VNDVTFAHNSAYGDSTFRSWVNLIRQRAPALYTFILKRLRTAQVSAVAVVIFANDCVPGAKSAILDFLKFQCSRNKNVQNANVVTIVVINIFTMLRPKRDWTKYRTSLCYCTLCIYKALDVYSVTIAIVTLNDTVLNTTYIVGLFRETSSAKLGKTEFTFGKIRLQRVAEVKHCTVRCVAPSQILETVAQQLQRAHPDDVGAREEDSDEEARSGGEHAERTDERISFSRQQSESRRRQRTSDRPDRPGRRDHGPEQETNTDNTPRPFFTRSTYPGSELVS